MKGLPLGLSDGRFILGLLCEAFSICRAILVWTLALSGYVL